MRIKKSQIGEILDTNKKELDINIKGDLPKPEDIQRSASEIEDMNTQIQDMNSKIEDSPMSAFLTKVSESNKGW